jgi:hypothetical protein
VPPLPLALRKAAFSALESLMRRAPDAVGPEALPLLCAGMRDHAPTKADNARVLAHAAFQRACASGIVRRALDGTFSVGGRPKV